MGTVAFARSPLRCSEAPWTMNGVPPGSLPGNYTQHLSIKSPELWTTCERLCFFSIFCASSSKGLGPVPGLLETGCTAGSEQRASQLRLYWQLLPMAHIICELYFWSDQRWHNKCNALESPWNHLSTPWSMKKLFYMKPIPDTIKAEDHCLKAPSFVVGWFVAKAYWLSMTMDFFDEEPNPLRCWLP